MSLPIIAITMGDPAGIGPEIIVKSLISDELYGNFSLIVIIILQICRLSMFGNYFLPFGIFAPGLPTYNPKKAAPAPTIVDMYMACEFVGSGNCINQVTDL